jgi:uncharacterized membrane protein YheB (UPF0754 family)
VTFIIQHLKFFFTFISPILVLVGLGLPFADIESEWLRNATIIITASTIGFYTNFIAIKMLFRPYQKTRFGRQGLIPQQKQTIATRLGESINEEFFNPKEFANYLRSNRLPEKLVSGLFSYARRELITAQNIETGSQYLQKYLQQPSTQRLLSTWLQGLKVDNKVIEYLQQAKLSGKLKVLLENEWKNNPQNIENLIDKFSYMAAEYIPEISELLVREFEHYVEGQSTIKRSIVSFMGWSDNITAEKLREQLYRFISTQEFRDALYQLIDKGIADIQDYLGSKEGHQWAQGVLNQYQEQITDAIQRHALPLLIKSLSHWLSQPKTMRILQYACIRGSRMARGRVHVYVMSEHFDEALQQRLPGLLKQIKLNKLIESKVSKYQSRQLEGLILRATGDHLQTIEVLGGLIGGVTGIALINPVYFAVILAVAGSFLLLENWLSQK